jgi:hypothetical protein
MKLRTLFIVLFFPLFIHAGTVFVKPDREAIEKAITDSTADTYYPKLLKRYNDFDSTLTVEEYRLLYYGFVFQPGYSGYDNHNKKEIQEELSAGMNSAASRLCDSVFKKIPVSLQTNYYKSLALIRMGKTGEPVQKYARRYRGLRDAILQTGDGKSQETALHVIFVTDEYHIMYYHFDLEQIKSQSLIYPCDMFVVKKNKKYRSKKIWFDISEAFNAMSKQFKKEKGE